MSKKNKKKKRRIVLSILFLILTPCYILLNLGQNSIYYYIRSKKTDKKLTLIVVVNNIDWVMKKPKRETVGKYRYMNGAILYRESPQFSYLFSSGYGSVNINTRFTKFNKKNDTSISYQLSPKLKITNVVEYKDNEIIERKAISDEQPLVDIYVKKLSDHVIKTRVEPPIFFNLQWLYDITFDEKKAYNLDDE